MSGKYTEKFKYLTTNPTHKHPCSFGAKDTYKAGQRKISPSALLRRHTGTINKVEKKLQRNSRRNDSDSRIFPSILIIFGTSGMRLIAVLKKASAARQKKSP